MDKFVLKDIFVKKDKAQGWKEEEKEIGNDNRETKEVADEKAGIAGQQCKMQNAKCKINL